MGRCFPCAGFRGIQYNTGLYGYNTVLCAIAIAGHTRRDFLWATVAVLLSVAMQWLGMAAGTITLTAPFVLAVWAVLSLKRLCRKKEPAYRKI
ncbi:urea transporter [Alistipes ihumii]|uniref:urea transporter n=1 Tax=Alistipes ihumii TaxID=1470347 RepID=UPI003462F42B